MHDHIWYQVSIFNMGITELTNNLSDIFVKLYYIFSYYD